MPFNLSTGEILVLLMVAVVVFGGRLPDVARRIGKSIHEFKSGMRDDFRRIEEEAEAEPPPGWKPPPDGEECVGFEAAPDPEPKA